MQYFQKSVVAIAIMLLIVTYSVIYFTTTNKKGVWNNVASKCPDYWIYDSEAIECISNVNTISNYSLDGKSACENYDWAIDSTKDHGGNISWDGVTYGSSLNCK